MRLPSRSAVATGLTLALAVTLPASFASPARQAAPAIIAASGHEHVPAGAVEHRHEVRVANTRISVSAPAKVQTRKRIRITGVVRLHGGKKRTKRPVRLHERQANGRWKGIRKKASTRVGRFVFKVPSGPKARVRIFRVVAPRHRGLRRAVARRKVVVTAPRRPAPAPSPSPLPLPPTSGPAPLGDPNDWVFIYDGGGRWNPCRTIVWDYNPDQEIYDALADVKEAFARVAARTGLKFSYRGLTDYNPATGEGKSVAPITVAWANSDQYSRFANGTVGVGGSRASYVGRPRVDATWEIRQGYMLLNAVGRLRPGYDVAGHATWGQVMTHELLHVLGLGHARGQEQVMYPVASPLNHNFGAGDLTGAWRVGARSGCL